MSKFWVIMSHTYLSRIKSKSFIISTAISFLFIIGLVNIQSIIETFSGDEADRIAVMDDSNQFMEPLANSVESTRDDLELVAFDGSEEEGKSAVSEDKYHALLVITLDENQLPQAEYYANSLGEFGNQTFFEQQLQQLKATIATQQSGIDQAILAQINEPVSFHAVALDESAKSAEEMNQARGIVNIMLFVLYLTVMVYGQMIMTDVANEKSSRVMELLVSSASAVTHMFAKIVGIALVGLTQIGSLVVVGYFLIQSKQEELAGGVFEYLGFQGDSISIFIYAILFFLLGYFLYATISAMLGSLVSRVEDANQMMFPMIFLIMIAFFIAVFGMNAPNSSLVYITSFIPFFSPMIMFMRVGMLDVPAWEVALSIGLLLATIALLGVIGAKVYKGGVLMYGKSSAWKDFKKAISLSKRDS
ncbi:ABC transporter permease [Oceanobacillus halophilus]|uniref:ABC transporter permease n=1 Tax=Oceanobacillus halophilus TaxID=930130 RepID=A0A494ZXM6_9BACI|nr:ABC transporter permease [Oceanobacillus halophilus]RKQ31268.1 ABC transporter permease [Oceanobacillus halophilus]